MATWPVMPEIRFGTFGEFFKRIDIASNDYPVVYGEQTVERAAAAAAVHIVAHAVFVRALAHDGVRAEALELLLEQLFVERLRVLQIRQTAELAQV